MIETQNPGRPGPKQLELLGDELAQRPSTIRLFSSDYGTFQAGDIDAMVARAKGAIDALMERGTPLFCAVSFGKDSSALLVLVLSTAVRRAEAGKAVPPIIVSHGDTLVESPEMSSYARDEIEKVRSFASRHGLPVDVQVATPLLSEQWVVRVIGGRGLPTFPGSRRDCTHSLKVVPQERARKEALKRIQSRPGMAGLPEPVVLVGTRFDESAARGAAMRARGESDIEVRRGTDSNGRPGQLFLSPLAFWTGGDVWELLGMAGQGFIASYSDFAETRRIYSDAMATSCVVVAEDMAEAVKASKACGARTGCWLCSAVASDRSMENMLATDERYGYMRPLNKLRNFIANTQWDMTRRQWVGRTINDGYITIGPDVYSPAMQEELLRYCMTIDVREKTAARAAGLARPRFQIIGAEQLAAIDAMWSLQAYARPFRAWAIYRDIYLKGLRYDVPDVPPLKRRPMPAPRYLYVGEQWDESERRLYSGLRDALHEAVAEDAAGCLGRKTLEDGREVLAINTEASFGFDAEGLALLMEFELDRMLQLHDESRGPSTSGYLFYVNYGCLLVKKGAEGEIDTMLRRSAFKVRHGLAGQLSEEAMQGLYARSVSQEERNEDVAARMRKAA